MIVEDLINELNKTDRNSLVKIKVCKLDEEKKEIYEVYYHVIADQSKDVVELTVWND